MEKTVYIMVGPAGTGKSTWVNEHKKGKDIVISKDTIREQVAGTLEDFYTYKDEKGYKAKVNKIYQKQISEVYAQDCDVYIDNLNVRRRIRIEMYKQFVAHGFKVVIVWMHRPFKVCFEQNNKRFGAKRVGYKAFKNIYTDIDVPKLGVDCDEVIYECGVFTDYQEEINEHINESHDSPYHAESISEHIELTIKNAKSPLAKEVAKFHDLGKSICKKYDFSERADKEYFRSINDGKYATYYNHEKVSACYYLAYMVEHNLFNKEHYLVLESIFQHMQAHKGFSQKVIDRHSLTEEEMELIEEFRQVDSISKEVDNELVENIKRIKQLGEYRKYIDEEVLEEFVKTDKSVRLVSHKQQDGTIRLALYGFEDNIEQTYTTLLTKHHIVDFKNKHNNKVDDDEVIDWLKEEISRRLYLEYKLGKENIRSANLLNYYREVNNTLAGYGLSPWFKIVYSEKNDLYTVSYLHQGVNFSDERARMARGLTLKSDGTIVLRGFNKFFNYKQLEHYDRYTKDFKKVFADMQVKQGRTYKFIEKLDGTLIILGEYNGGLLASTTSSLNNPMAEYVTNHFNKQQNKEELAQWLKEKDMCACFEWVGPNNQIVVKYDEEDYVSLALIEKATGNRHQLDSVHREFVELFGYTQPKVYKMTFDEVQKYMKEAEGFEGFVTTNHKGNLIKFKTDDWFKHSEKYSVFFGNKITKNQVRTLFTAYLEDDLDDFLGRSENVDKLVQNMLDLLKDLDDTVTTIYEDLKGLSKKEIAQTLSKLDVNGIVKSSVFNKVNGRDTIIIKQESMIVNYLVDKLS